VLAKEEGTYKTTLVAVEKEEITGSPVGRVD
jgi:hypothetical protein